MAKRKEKRPADGEVSTAPKVTRAQAIPFTESYWYWAVAATVALVAGFIIYSPAANGPFVLDDLYQFFGRPEAPRMTFAAWITSGIRPLLNVTFWINYQLSGADPSSYHTINVLLHAMASVMLLVILRRLWKFAGGTGELAPIFGAALFLLHPMQVESVAYVSSRSETLSVLLAYAALAIQLSSKESALSIGRIAAMLACLGLAVLTKEHTVAMPAVFLLVDYFWRGGWQGVRANWRLHAVTVAAGLAGLVFVSRVLRGAKSAGFGLQDLTPATYLFTQFRMFWRYLRMILLPVGLNVDPDIPISHSLLEHGAIIGAVALVALLAAAWIFRERARLAAFGIFVFVLLLAPTSSVVPILDVFAERRMYLPFIGLSCIALECLRRWKIPTAVPTVILALLAFGSWQRSAVWASEDALWTDSIANSPNKYRPRFQIAYLKYAAGRCGEAVPEFERASKLGKGDVTLYLDWALALDCAGKQDEALAKLRIAAQMENSAHVQATIGMMHGKMNNLDQALIALEAAEKLDPNHAITYVYRGNVYLVQGRRADAAAQYQHALALDPGNAFAMQGLANLRRQ